MTNSSPNAAQWLVLIIGGFIGIWQFKKGLSAWRDPDIPKSLLFFPLTRFRQKNKLFVHNKNEKPSHSVAVQMTEALLNMLIGTFLMLLPLVGLVYVLLG